MAKRVPTLAVAADVSGAVSCAVPNVGSSVASHRPADAAREQQSARGIQVGEVADLGDQFVQHDVRQWDGATRRDCLRWTERRHAVERDELLLNVQPPTREVDMVQREAEELPLAKTSSSGDEKRSAVAASPRLRSLGLHRFREGQRVAARVAGASR